MVNPTTTGVTFGTDTHGGGRILMTFMDAVKLTHRWGLAGSDCIALPASPSGKKKTVQRAPVWSSAASPLEKRKTNPCNYVCSNDDVHVQMFIWSSCHHAHVGSRHLRVGDEHLFRTTWGWKPAVLPAVQRLSGCSRSRSSCGCCSDTCHCGTTIHTEIHTHTHSTLIQLRMFLLHKKINDKAITKLSVLIVFILSRKEVR